MTDFVHDDLVLQGEGNVIVLRAVISYGFKINQRSIAFDSGPIGRTFRFRVIIPDYSPRA